MEYADKHINNSSKHESGKCNVMELPNGVNDNRLSFHMQHDLINGMQRNIVNLKSIAQRKTNVIQLNREEVQNFFQRLRCARPSHLYLYSHICADGMGDAGQLKFLKDKIESMKGELGDLNIDVLATFSLSGAQEENKRKQEIKQLISISDDSLKYSTIEDHRAKVKPNNGWYWEIEYPYPDSSFYPGKNTILKIKEMGDGSIPGVQKTGEIDEGIGYGIPETATSRNSSFEVVKSKLTSLNNGISDFEIKILLSNAWLVNAKRYKTVSGAPDLSQNNIDGIKTMAQSHGSKLLFFLGVNRINEKEGDIYILYGGMNNDVLRYVMNEITDGVIVSGGEGMYAESLGSRGVKENGKVCILAGRYYYQYMEIADALYYRYGGQIEKKEWNEKNNEQKQELIQYAFFMIKGGKTVYHIKSDETVQSIISQNQAYIPLEFFKGKTLVYSKNLSALYLPLSLNGLGDIECPSCISLEDALNIYKEEAKRLYKANWFDLIDEGIKEDVKEEARIKEAMTSFILNLK